MSNWELDAYARGQHRQPYIDIDDAKRRVRRNRKHLDAGQIWSENVASRSEDLLDVAGYLDPAMRTYIDKHSRVSMMLSFQP